MRLTTCEYQQQQYLGVVIDTTVALPALAGPWPKTMLELIDGGPSQWARLEKRLHQMPSKARVPLEEVKLLAPIPRPRKNIMCLGLNYADHASEALEARDQAIKLPDHPVVFTKAPTSVNGPFSDIPFVTRVSTKIDWEVELGLVIGKKGRGIPVATALQHVFGYTVINDISARDIQSRHQQFFLGKSLDGACPMGPWIVTVDEISDPQDLDLRCWVNGILKQDSNTRHQIFSVATAIAILSHGTTLEPGDIVATGTPAGVGYARTPPEFLTPGDVVECEVGKIGRLRNSIVEINYR
jgi:2-keto-4-pentenoate hydratase/2-oxohepta-3-ene-1,7-dioic acid hydratase in catechol pathway|tara:strand:+ start:3291 stop:4181 length:891 start_codon:yes stop_codon:yes gene_type:complete